MRIRLAVLTVIAFAFQHGVASASPNTNFLAAADFSGLAFFESKGITYKDGGQVQDGIQILKNHGINCVRLRLWTSSPAQAAANPYNFINNTAYTVPLAVRVKNAGLLFSLDFHYSDTWADPGHQKIPNAWTNLNLTQLVQEMYYYNSNTIAIFATAGAMPDFVQVGNEITQGMLFNYGKVSGSDNDSWSQLGQLMKAAVQGIQDASSAHGYPVPKIIVHIDRGGDWATTQWFFENLNYQGVPYDIIGESYYPFYQGSLTALNTCLSNAAVEFSKPIVVAEDAFPYTNNFPTSWTNNGSGYGLYGYPPTPDGQVSFVAAVGQIIRNVPNNLGYGFFYWGTEYQAASGVNEAGFNTSSFFDQNGNLLPVANTVGGMGMPFILTQPTNLTILAGNNASFSAAVIGATPIAYQWQQNGTNLADGTGISGANTTNLTLADITNNSTAKYTLVITNVYGSVTSSVATLTVFNPAPAITGFAVNPDGSFSLNFAGTPGSTYVLETTTNFLSTDSWQPIVTNTFDNSGVWQFTDVQAAVFQQQFYRLKLGP
jgi:arabinogalactan endo-1,4-beta-galactosidase